MTDRPSAGSYEAIAWVQVEVHGATRQLRVDRCPFCGQMHRHGAGRPDEPVERYLGVREQRCTRPYLPRRYLLKVGP